MNTKDKHGGTLPGFWIKDGFYYANFGHGVSCQVYFSNTLESALDQKDLPSSYLTIKKYILALKLYFEYKMHISHRFKILFLILIFICSNYILSNEYYFERINSRQGLSQNDILSIYQDSEGFMWFCTNDGLNRYDGYNFKTYRANQTGKGLSSNIARLIAEDENKVLWISTNRNNIDRFSLLTETFIEDDQLSKILNFSTNIESIIHYKKITYVLCQNELIIIDRNTSEPVVQHYSNKNQSVVDMSMLSYMKLINDTCSYIITRDHAIIKAVHKPGSITFSYFRRKNNRKAITLIPYANGIITAGFSGVTYIDSTLTSYTITDIGGREVLIDNSGYLWYASYSGLLKFKPTQNEIPFQLEKHFTGGKKNTTISGNIVLSLHKDNSGIIWIGTEGAGINKLNPNRKKFHFYESNETEGSISSNVITKIYEDRKHNVWFGQKNSGLSVLNIENEKRFSDGFYNYNKDLFEFGYIRDINEITLNGKQQLFIASSDMDFNQTFNPKLTDDPLGNRLLQLFLRYVFAFEQDDEMIWFGSYNGGLMRYSLQDEMYARFYADSNNSSICSNIVLDILCDSQKRIWIATSDGLNLLSPEEKNKKAPFFNRYQNNHEDTTSLSNNFVSILFETSDNMIIVGTLGGGLNIYNDKLNSFSRITTSDGLPNDAIKGILEDGNKNLWVSTNNGLSKINLANYQISNYDILDGLQDNEFGEFSCCKLHDGQMIFGGVSGFNVFYPDEIIDDSVPPKIVFTDFQVLNREVGYNDEINFKMLLNNSIDNTQEIKLNYSENSFTIFFTGLYYANPSNVKYKYKLDGFDNDWQTAFSNHRFAKYTNIKPGTYSFMLNAANPDGYWNYTTRELKIRIAPPLYRTKLAYLVYLIVVVSLALAYRRYYENRIKIEHALEMERFEKAKVIELSKVKLKFFTNISHEFRTPLSLIKICFDGLQKGFRDSIKEDVNEYLETGNRNIDVLMRLINQLIDFRKMEQGKLSLETNNSDIVLLLKNIYNSFKIIAQKNRIQFEFKSDKEVSYINIDSDKIEKVFYNLLSNAFKYTQSGNTVKLGVQHGPGNVVILVEDTGVGIPAEQQEYIFERFYHVQKIGQGVSGSGIGLSLTKELIEMHNGSISFSSVEGKGTTFRVSLPLISNTEFTHQTSNGEAPLLQDVVNKQSLAPKTSDTVRSLMDGELESVKKTILIVEDNVDLRQFIVNDLKEMYKVLEAPHGDAGLKLCLEHSPDLVISDIMMPFKNGLELCHDIKNNIQTSHIPVILLTAKTLDEHKIEGYEHGADAYVSKPFNFEVLKLQIKALFDFANNLHKKFQAEPDIKPHMPGILPIDQQFIEKVHQSIEKNMSRPEYSIEELADDCHVSTSTLIRKFKHLIGTTPKGFIRIRRLKYAEKLLKENKKTIHEIIQETGFVDYSHFAKTFKKEFGVTPKKYRAQ